MRRLYSTTDILVLPDDLRAFAWSAPMRTLAGRLNVSDVGLKKLLASYGVAPPPQGYWNKVAAGKLVPRPLKAPPRRPGEIGRFRVDARFKEVLPPAPPMSADGPFASAAVPEDLAALYDQELAAIGRAPVPKTLDAAHRGLRDLLKQEQRRREKVAEREWHWDKPKFQGPLERRMLRILNGLLNALAKRGHDGDVHESNDKLTARAIIGDMYLGLDIEIAGKHRTVRDRGRTVPAPGLPASTSLLLRIRPDFDRAIGPSWQDDAAGTLETKMAAIAATIIVEGEAKFRRSLREAEERAEQQSIAEQRRREEELAERNRKRLQHLRESGELLRQAQDIRALVDRVRNAIVAGGVDVDSDTLEAWAAWALAEADRIDPIRSGQIMSHLEEPKL